MPFINTKFFHYNIIKNVTVVIEVYCLIFIIPFIFYLALPIVSLKNNFPTWFNNFLRKIKNNIMAFLSLFSFFFNNRSMLYKVQIVQRFYLVTSFTKSPDNIL